MFGEEPCQIKSAAHTMLVYRNCESPLIMANCVSFGLEPTAWHCDLLKMHAPANYCRHCAACLVDRTVGAFHWFACINFYQWLPRKVEDRLPPPVAAAFDRKWTISAPCRGAKL